MSRNPSPIPAVYAESCGLVIVAAGGGIRFGGAKQLASLAGKPLLVHALEAFAPVPFGGRALVLPPPWLADGTWENLRSEWPVVAAFAAVAGGETRALSVRHGLEALPPSLTLVAVHDGARPFPPLDAVGECFKMLHDNPAIAAAIVASPVTDTLKRVTGEGSRIAETADRDAFRRAETPQVVRRELLLAALGNPDASSARDEAEALERAGHPTACALHHGYNPKITHPGDLALAEGWLQTQA